MRWIREALTFHLPERDGLGLDFYHLGTNVHRAQRTVFGEESVAGRKWAEELLHHFKHEGYEPTWNRLVQWRATVARSPQKRPAADRPRPLPRGDQWLSQFPNPTPTPN